MKIKKPLERSKQPLWRNGGFSFCVYLVEYTDDATAENGPALFPFGDFLFVFAKQDECESHRLKAASGKPPGSCIIPFPCLPRPCEGRE